MLKTETKQLLDQIATIDNRKVTPETIEAWHLVIGQIPFDIAKEALKLAQQDASVKYLEPRHIFSWAKEAAFRLDKNKMPEDVKQTGFAPQPICKDHNLPILSCKPCCHRLHKFQQAHGGADLHSFAKAEIYA